MSKKSTLTYRDAGVDIDAGHALVERIKPMVARTKRPEVMGGLGGFGGLFELGDHYTHPVLVSGTDGVGTKLMLALAHDRIDQIGIDLVAMCVNDILVCGAKPLFFLDYYACGKLDVDQGARVVDGIASGCEQAGCALIGGETAEMPDMYAKGDFDLAGFAVGVVEKSAMITGQSIEVGSSLIGIASSGPHSNGYSLLRRLLERTPDAPTTKLGDKPLLDALLAPTQIYVRAVDAVLSSETFEVLGMAHITGGGLTDNITRVIPEHLGIRIDLDAWPMPPIFQWVADTEQVNPEEMRRTFNLGIGFVLIVPPEQAGDLCAFIRKQAELDAWPIGEVIPSLGKQRVIYAGG